MSFIDEDDDPLNPQNEQRKAKAVQVREKTESEALARLRFIQDCYRRILNADGGQAVLEDLKRFCRGAQTAWADDPRYHALLCGRQEVWLRIEEYLTLSFDDLVNRRS